MKHGISITILMSALLLACVIVSIPATSFGQGSGGLSKSELDAFKKANKIKELQKEQDGTFVVNLLYTEKQDRKNAWKKSFRKSIILAYEDAVEATKQEFRRAYSKHKCAHSGPYRAPFYGARAMGTGRYPGCTECAARDTIQENENDVWLSIWGKKILDEEPEMPLNDKDAVAEVKISNGLKITPLKPGSARVICFVQPRKGPANMGLGSSKEKKVSAWARFELNVRVLDPTGKAVPEDAVGSGNLRKGERLVGGDDPSLKMLLDALRQAISDAELVMVIEIVDKTLPKDRFFTMYSDIDNTRWFVGLMRKPSGNKVSYERILFREKAPDSETFIMKFQ